MTNCIAGFVSATIWIAFPHLTTDETTHAVTAERPAAAFNAESTGQQPASPDQESESPPAPGSSGQLQSEATRQPPQSFVGGRDTSSRLVEGKSVMISWSENNDELRGFSRITGEWTRVSIKVSPKRVIIPVVGDMVAAVKLDDAMTAYSGTTGRWDTVQLSKNSQAFPSVDSEVVYVHDGGHHYTFAASSGRWTSPTDPELQSDHLSYQYNMKTHGQLERHFADWLNSSQNKHRLYLSATFTGGPSSSRQIILQSTRQSAMTAARAKLKELETSSAGVASSDPFSDQDPFSNQDPFSEANPSADDPFGTSAGNTPNQTASSSRAIRPSAISSNPKIAQLSKKLTQIEDECQNMAAIIRNTNKVMTDPSGKNVTVPKAGVLMPNNQVVWHATNDNLKSLVDQAFEIRQEIHTLETQRMQQKLQTIQSSLDARQKNRERIVQRRTEELLDPEGQLTRWDFALPAAPSDHDASANTANSGTSHGPQEPAAALSQAQPNRQHSASTESAATDTNLHDAENMAVRLRLCQLGVQQAEQRIAALKRTLQELAFERQKVVRQVVTTEDKTTEVKNRVAAESNLSEEATDKATLKIIEATMSAMESQQSDRDRLAREWQVLWKTYQAKLHLRQLDLQEAQTRMTTQTKHLELVNQQYLAGLVSSETREKADFEFKTSQIQLARVNADLQFYTDIITNEPELDPNYQVESSDSAPVNQQ